MHFHPIEHTADEAYLTQAQDNFQVEMDIQAANDALDDVFGSDSTSPIFEHHDAFPGTSHPSDMRRLQAEHSTAGYREGVTVAKESSLQAGFDEGFSLGASIGLKAGQLLGVIEGIADAVRGLEDADSLRVKGLVREAREDLSIATIFKPDYWAEDGNWKYEVPAPGAEDEVVFSDVAKAHPLIRKWTAIVDEQIVLWKIDRAILDDETGERVHSVMDEPILSSALPTTRKPLDW
ncbi:hypothetical protein B0T10DRAFT_69326 [Thelonectria olida]|uniref:Protein YAE1 n=1 Tax=Thelonectria olida TaxID=1576542 RepID=A0A9P9ART6_9HYPO|nr:hypothetical protein B0T10DRAFT_69326 [Thelonectria olida]